MILIWFSLKLTLAERGCERKLISDFYGSYTGWGGGGGGCTSSLKGKSQILGHTFFLLSENTPVALERGERLWLTKLIMYYYVLLD